MKGVIFSRYRSAPHPSQIRRAGESRTLRAMNYRKLMSSHSRRNQDNRFACLRFASSGMSHDSCFELGHALHAAAKPCAFAVAKHTHAPFSYATRLVAVRLDCLRVWWLSRTPADFPFGLRSNPGALRAKTTSATVLPLQEAFSRLPCCLARDHRSHPDSSTT